MSEAPQERVFLDREGVRVTSARFQVPGQTFAMASVSSVSFVEQPASRGGAMALVICGALIALMGFAVRSEDVGSSGATWLAVGAALIVAGFLSSKRGKPTFVVSLSTAGGQVKALSSQNRAQIERVVLALNDALVSRG